MLIPSLVLCASTLMLSAPEASQQSPQPQTVQTAAPQASQPAPTADAEASARQAEQEKVVDGVKLEAIEVNLVSYTNDERVRNGLPPLEVDKDLMETARTHAAWMTRTHNMVHTALAVAENIAMGQPHSSEAVRSWMNSPGHRANILNPGHRHIGVAAYCTENGTIFWCQQFQP
jgi:uncharacterized protein YkwD